MASKPAIVCVLAAVLASCGGPPPSERASEPPERPAQRETVFDPLTSTIGRAQGVQQTVDAQAAEQRRRIEEAER
jgi:hypothetical protein